ncbi:MAG: SUMF1/EgtB/PvdO family nonheme iron enzyme, partial [Planctomycetota bacterium]|nr:SUMF1/EgtB/PvdO family nonheme iron enzyme [Planctomycetota bacterium]
LIRGAVVCKSCSAPIVKMIEAMKKKTEEKSPVAKPAAKESPPTWGVEAVTAEEKPAKDLPARPKVSGRLAAADEAMKRRERLMQQVDVTVKKPERRGEWKMWVVIAVGIVVVIAVVLVLQQRARIAFERNLLSELRRKVENALESGDFEKTFTLLSEFEVRHPDLKGNEEFLSLSEKAKGQVRSFFENAEKRALQGASWLDNLVNLVNVNERLEGVLPLARDEKLTSISGRLKGKIAEYRQEALKHLDELKEDFEKDFLAFDFDSARAALGEWNKIFETVKKGLSEEDSRKNELSLLTAQRKMEEAVKELKDKWVKVVEEGSVKEGEGDYESAVELYAKYCEVKEKSVAEVAKVKWTAANAEARKHRTAFENDSLQAEEYYKNGYLENARDIYRKYVEKGMVSIRLRAKTRLEQIEKEISARDAKRSAFQSEYETNNTLLKNNPQKALEWCRETLKRIETIPLSDAESRVLRLRDEAYKELGFCPLPKGDFTVGSSEPFDENPLRQTRLSAGVYLEKYEVSNAQFKEFIDAGGYREKKFWSEEGWSLAERFVDTTGKPGPSFWRNGTYPHGTADEPVRGVSWYEAEAFARWAGKRLPTAEEWEVAAGWDASARKILEYPWGDDDKEGVGTIGTGKLVDVKKDFGDVSPSGVVNMGGNVSEWTATVKDKQALVKGGNFIDSEHKAARVRFSERLPLDSRPPYVGFRCVKEEK